MEKLKVGIGEALNSYSFGVGEPRDYDACPVCDGTGFEITKDSRGYTFTRPCRTCRQLEKARERLLFKMASLPPIPRDVATSPIVEDYLDGFPLFKNSNSWILFSGKTGSGKTTSASYLASQIIKRYRTQVRFYSAFEITRRLASCKNIEEHKKLIDVFATAPFIVLDDFLKVFPRKDSFQYPDFMEATLEIFWTRNDNHLPLCVTTQREYKEIASFDSALAGRLAMNCKGRVVTFNNQSRNWRLTQD